MKENGNLRDHIITQAVPVTSILRIAYLSTKNKQTKKIPPKKQQQKITSALEYHKKAEKEVTLSIPSLIKLSI